MISRCILHVNSLYSRPLSLSIPLLFSGLYREVKSVCLLVTWRSEDKKAQVFDVKVGVKKSVLSSFL